MIVVNEIHDFEEIPPTGSTFHCVGERLKTNHLHKWLVSFLGCSCRIKDTKAFKIDLNSTVTTPAPYFLVSILRLQEADEVVLVVGLQDVESLVHKPAPAFGRALEH